jgi:hypothetical protein
MQVTDDIAAYPTRLAHSKYQARQRPTTLFPTIIQISHRQGKEQDLEVGSSQW